MTAYRIVFTMAIVAHAGLLAAQTKAPVPDAQAQAKATALVKEIFKAEYDAAKTASQKEALAKNLLDLAGQTKKLPDRYAILRVAGALSMEAGSPICFQAVDEMAKSFQIDSLDMKARVLPRCAAKATAEQSKVIAQTGISLVHQALANDRHDLAKQLISPTSSAARRSKDIALAKQANDLAKKINAAAKAYAEVKAAEAALGANPADPAANLTAGKYHCFVKGDWAKGLPMLALSGDPALKSLAEKELRGVTAATDLVVVADGWWALAEKEDGLAKEQLQSHAVACYTKVLPQLKGLTKLRIEKRLQKINESVQKTSVVRPKLSGIQEATVHAWPNERGEIKAAIDGDLKTSTWTTKSGNKSPACIALDFHGVYRLAGIRLWKDNAGGGGANVKNLVIQYTSDPANLPVSQRTWKNVSRLATGRDGKELLHAEAVNADGTVFGDVHDSVNKDHGWAFLSFDAVNATGVRITIAGSSFIHYKVHEFQAYAWARLGPPV